MKHEKVQQMTVTAVMLALATVLSLIKVFELPQGGSITAASMTPIIVISMLYKTKWSLFASVIYAGLQMLTGFYPPPTQDFLSFLAVIMLDYVLAFGVLGFAGLIAKPFKYKPLGAVVATLVVLAARLLCHFLSGILVWSSYAPEGQPVWAYSLGYNGAYILGEAIITSVAIFLLMQVLPVFKKQPAVK